MRRPTLIIVLTWLIVSVVALPCLASDVAVLKNGFSIRHERREVIGEVTRLYTNADGSSFVDVPTAEIEHFETLPAETAPTDPVPASAAGTVTGSNLSSIGFPGRPQPTVNDMVNEASGRYRLDPDLVNSVIKAESAFNPRAVSPKGAQGLMQLMPGTASQLGVTNAFDPQANVNGGARYLRELMERYDFDIVKALAAYNAGPEKVNRFGGVPPYSETKLYVKRVVVDFNKKKAEKASGAQKTTTKTQMAKAAQRNSPSPVQTSARSAAVNPHKAE